MKKTVKKLIIAMFAVFGLLALGTNSSYAAMQGGVWVNDLKDIFSRNQAIILGVNIRTFNAQDKNKNDIIDFDKGEVSGNFINAIQRLDEIKAQGINTIHLLPITPVGKVKAIGTAGSLYAASDLTKLNPQLDDKTNKLSVKEEAKLFIKEAHKRNIRVIVDLPSCGSYDYFLSNPSLFMTGADGQPIVPSDWTDVRLFKVQNSDGSLNNDVYLLFRNYVDMVQSIGADGIRADVATSKPFEFWKQLISYARSKDPQFMFLAEASEAWSEPIASVAPFTPYYKLLEAGFDGYYGSFFNFKDWKTASEFEKELKQIQNVKKQYSEPKSVIGSFATHDVVSPIITGGMPYSEMILWIQSTLPMNSYFLDGFQTGDAYEYKYANQKASKSFTDDEYYYVHKGKFDIFNFSRKPGGVNKELPLDFPIANNFKMLASEIINRGEVSFIPTENNDVFAYVVNYKYSYILVIINKDLIYQNDATISLNKFGKSPNIVPIKIENSPSTVKNKMMFKLSPGETAVFLLSKSSQDKKK